MAKSSVKTGSKEIAVKSPITWFGGKARLAEQIVGLLPDSACFVDVFGGSAAILLARPPSRKRIDVYNDISEDLVNLFRVLRQPTTATMLQAQLEGTPYSRAEFNLSLKHCDEPLEQARRFIVRQRMSHGGLGKVFAYGVTETNDGKPNVVNRFHTGVARLPLVSARFKNVIIEQST